MLRAMFGFGLSLLVGLLPQTAYADHKGPHGGIVVEWGEEELHPEIVVDHIGGKVMVFVYGDHSDLHKKKRKAIEAKSITLQLKDSSPLTLTATPEKGDPKGASSKFIATSEILKKTGKLEGTLSGKVGAKQYSGDFK